MEDGPSSNGTRAGSPVQRDVSPWAFAVVYLGWAYLFWSMVVASGASVWSFPNVALFAIGGSSPLVAGLGLAWFTRGRAGLVDLWRRLVDARRVGPRWWAVVLLFHPAFTLLVAALRREPWELSAELAGLPPDCPAVGEQDRPAPRPAPSSRR